MGNNLRQIHRLLWVILAALIFLMASQFNLAIIQGKEYSERSVENRTRTISVMGSRGRILDTNGVPLAYDKTSYNINFYRDPYQTGEKWRAIYTNIILETIEILEKNGNKGVYVKNKNGAYVFTRVKVISSDDKESVIEDVTFTDDEGNQVYTVDVYDEVLKHPKSVLEKELKKEAEETSQSKKSQEED